MLWQRALADHVVERLEREIRIDRAGAVANQQRDVMHLARVARFEHQRATRPRALAHQVMVHARGREQARDRRELRGRRRDPTGSGCCGRPSPPRWPAGTAASIAAREARRRLLRAGTASAASIDRNRRCSMWRSFASCSLSMIGIRDADLAARLGLRLQQVALRARSSTPSTSRALRGSRRAAGS